MLGTAFLMGTVFVHPSRFDDSLPWFSPIVSSVRLHSRHLIPCFVGLLFVYLHERQRMRMFAVSHQQLARRGEHPRPDPR